MEQNNEPHQNDFSSCSPLKSAHSSHDTQDEEPDETFLLAGDGLTTNFNQYLKFDIIRDGSIIIRYTFMEFSIFEIAKKLAVQLERYNQDRMVLVIQRNYQYGDILERQLRKLGIYTVSVGANKPNHKSLAKDFSIFRPAITSMEYLATHPYALKAPEVICNFDHVIPRMHFLERFIRHRHQQSDAKKPIVIEVFNFCTPNSKIGNKAKDIFGGEN